VGTLVLPQVLAPTRGASVEQEAHWSALRRVEMWRAGATMLRASGWRGVGIGQFRRLSGGIRMSGAAPFFPPHVHNIFLQTALDLGLFGLVFYLGLTVVILRTAFRTAQTWDGPRAFLAAGSGLSLVAVHVFGMTDAIALGAKVGIFQWAAAGLIVAAAGAGGRPQN
jgi:putative inorganic carbon (HCO3(-)) transporter